MSKTNNGIAKNLEIVERHSMQVFEDQIEIVRVKDGFLYVPLSSLCMIMNLNVTDYALHLQENTILSENFIPCVVTDGKEDTELLRIDMMAQWLVGLDVNRVGESHRHVWRVNRC